MGGVPPGKRGKSHASHEACELKSAANEINLADVKSHASHEACELKLIQWSPPY